MRTQRAIVELWIDENGVEGRVEVAGGEDRSFGSVLELLCIIEQLRVDGPEPECSPPASACAADGDPV